MNNYELSRDRAQEFFLRFDQNKIIADWQLKHDRCFLYLDFFGRPYRIARETGEIFRQWDGRKAGFQEVLTIFDLLCHPGEDKCPSGNYAPVNSLKGVPRAAGVGTDFHSGAAGIFDSRPDVFRAACIALGAEEVPMGDLGFRFPVFSGLSVILKFYHADEEFPASLTLLWDDHALMYMHYETVFYAAGFLLGAIREEMEKIRQD